MSHSTQDPNLLKAMKEDYTKRLEAESNKLDPVGFKEEIQKALNTPFDNPYYEEAKQGVIKEYLEPNKWSYVALLKCHWATTHMYYQVYRSHAVLADSHRELLKQIDAAYQEVFKRLNTLRQAELTKEIR